MAGREFELCLRWEKASGDDEHYNLPIMGKSVAKVYKNEDTDTYTGSIYDEDCNEIATATLPEIDDAFDWCENYIQEYWILEAY